MGIWSRIRRTFREDRHTDDIQEELAFHLEMDAADGHDSAEACRRLGNVTRIAEETRAMGVVEWLDSALQDARYALRQIRKTPVLVSAVVLSLAIGVGANTAIFSLVDAAILRPLPVKDPDSLLIVEWTNEGFPPDIDNHNGEYVDKGGRKQGSSVSASLYRRLAREQKVFEELIGISAYPDTVAISLEGAPAEQTGMQYVSANFFRGLGLTPVRGRPFRDDEDRVGQEPVVIVSHRFWRSRLGGADSVLDSKVRINNVPARIIGVAPPGFFGVRAGQWPDIYAPLASTVAFQPGQRGGPSGENDRNWWVRQLGRLKPGISESAATNQIAGLFRNMITPNGVEKIPELVTLPGRRGWVALNSRDTGALWILMLLVSVLLLIVCANVANLLLSRSVSRQRESAVRLAMGAGRSRLFRQHLIESGVLALLGGSAGLGLGYLCAQSIHALFQSGASAVNGFDLHVDFRILGFTAALSALTALLFGLAPAVRAARADLGDTLKAQMRSVIGGGLGLPRLLVSLQIALCLTALVAALLLGQSLDRLKGLDVGFAREHIAYATVNPGQAGYTAERVGPYADRVLAELARLPGVTNVSPVATRLIAGGGNNGAVNFADRPFNTSNRANVNGVGDTFFQTMGIPLVMGRAIERRDRRPDVEGVVIDDSFARQYFPGQNPLGRRFGMGPDENSRYEVVGVAANSHYNSLRGDPVPTVYQPWRAGGGIHFAIRTSTQPAQLATAVRKAVATVDPAVPLVEFRTQTELIDRTIRTERLLGFVSGAFGLVALTLAAIGLGGLLAYAVARRTNEIGVRMALGAASADVVRMVLRDSLRMAVTGIVVGLPCAYWVATYLKSALFMLELLDPWTAGISLLALLAVAVVSAWIPARRAAAVDPMTALREE